VLHFYINEVYLLNLDVKFVNADQPLKVWKFSHPDYFELCHAANLNYDYPAHIHEEHCIALVLRGKEITVSRGTNHVARAGEVLLINAEEVHSSQSFETELKVFKVRPRTLQRIAFDICGVSPAAPHFSEFVCQNKKIFRLFLNLFGKLTASCSPLEQESEFICAMAELLAGQNANFTARETVGKEPRGVRAARDFLKAHYAENVSLSELARIANLSRFYLLRVFRRATGVPPHEYQTQIRVARARKLLRQDCSILDAALETGFFDQSHFSRNFKRITGRTPGNYLAESNIVQDLS
jgi:AraC-like DNA-binding protein